MPEPTRFAPDDPREWLNRARSDLALAQEQIDGVYLEDLCFHAQQAAEKAIKAILIRQHVEFPYIHDLGRLLDLVVEGGITLPTAVEGAPTLTRFAVLDRYPGLGSHVRREEHEEAVRIADAVVRWAESVIVGNQ